MITVIMPVHNAEPYLSKSLHSILNQTVSDIEVIVVNDGSTDRTEDIVRSVNDPRIRYFRQEHSGTAAARNLALDAARGEFIVWQDADDVSLPNRFAELLAHFSSPTVGFVHSDMLLIDENDRPLGYWRSGQITSSRILRSMLRYGTPYNNGTMMIRRNVLGLERQDPSLWIGEDTDFVLRLAQRCESIHIAKPLLLYRRHPGNTTRTVNYKLLAQHVEKFLCQHSLQDLVPEVTWSDTLCSPEVRARVIIAILLMRRGLGPHAEQWFAQAVDMVRTPQDRWFAEALGHLMTGNYIRATVVLERCEIEPHIALNYLGEAYAYLGDVQAAWDYFYGALQYKPDYQEPYDNLRALGGMLGVHDIDPIWTKYLAR